MKNSIYSKIKGHTIVFASAFTDNYLFVKKDKGWYCNYESGYMTTIEMVNYLHELVHVGEVKIENIVVYK